MIDKDDILQLIKRSVISHEPDATLIVYGSYARGDFRNDSDIDILIQTGDYDDFIEYSKEDVLDLIEPAQKLIKKAEELLNE